MLLFLLLLALYHIGGFKLRVLILSLSVLAREGTEKEVIVLELTNISG